MERKVVKESIPKTWSQTTENYVRGQSYLHRKSRIFHQYPKQLAQKKSRAVTYFDLNLRRSKAIAANVFEISNNSGRIEDRRNNWIHRHRIILQC
jgi:hypothetical protein